jgi:transcriptional regulator with XRE-family HTH domain
MRRVLSRPAGQKRSASTITVESRLREMRLNRGLSQDQLADLAGMHRNTIYRLEAGLTKEVTQDHAVALAAALHSTPRELALTIHRAGIDAPRSVRFRQLSPEQRQLIDELMALPAEDYATINAALQTLRAAKRRKERRRK